MQNNRVTIYLISNMYPSKRNVRYGIFVKNFEAAVKGDFIVKKCVLTKKESVVAKLFGYLLLYFKIFCLIFKAKKQDIIYVHFPLHVAPMLWFVQLFKKQIVLNFHGSDLIFNTVFTKILSQFLKPLIIQCAIVVPSVYYKTLIIKKYKIKSGQVFVYPSGGINTAVFYPQVVKKREEIVLGFVSNFIKSKGWEVLLLAVKEVLNKQVIKNLEIVFIGDGPDKEAIIELSERIGVKYNITSNISQKELALRYNEFDLFIFPTYRKAESLGLVGLEAMACGVPVVAGKVGGPMGYINHGINSFLFEKKSSKDLVNKILLYFSLSENEKQRIKLNAIKTAKLYDSRKVNMELLLFLKDLK
ncbi:glycosyltransferase family 4 protein [Formosa haliotis]|uniref:glycosyltransferase family 4 protein n=1 Tax=Formosa haliotis TaxID=1555194 RepID=UPI000824DF98|nr:glycosyltransferase family 4 protein [Formosa haliotis]